MTNRWALSGDHPEHPYNYIKREFDVDPSTYGVKHPHEEEFEGVSRSQLIDELVRLRKDFVEMERFYS